MDDEELKPEELTEDDFENYQDDYAYQDNFSDENPDDTDEKDDGLEDSSYGKNEALEDKENSNNEEEKKEYDILNAEEIEKGDPDENKGAFINRNMIFLTVGGIVLVFFFFCIFILPQLMKKNKPEEVNALDKAGKIFIPDEFEEEELSDDEPVYINSNSAEDNFIDNNKTSIPAIDRDRSKEAPVPLPDNTVSGMTGSGNSNVVQTNRNELQKAAFYVPLEKDFGLNNKGSYNGSNYPQGQNGSYQSGSAYQGGSSYQGGYNPSSQGYSYSSGSQRLSSPIPASLSMQSMMGNNYQNQNNQSAKEEFMNKDRLGGGNYTWNSDISLWKGTIIPAVLETGINTDNPGEVIATVTTNIYSSNDGRYILIPQGSRLFAHYNSDISYAQNRVQVAWNTLIRPDGLEINLGSLNGVDSKGYSGYKGFKSEHPFEYAKAIGLIAMFSIIDTKASNLIDTNGNTYAQNAMSDVWQTQKNLNNKIIERALDIQPTIRIKSGTEIKLITNTTMEIPPLDPSPVTQKYVRY